MKVFATADLQLVIQCRDCGHFTATDNGCWVCRHCSVSMIGFAEAQAEARKAPARSIWRTWKRADTAVCDAR